MFIICEDGTAVNLLISHLMPMENGLVMAESNFFEHEVARLSSREEAAKFVEMCVVIVADYNKSGITYPALHSRIIKTGINAL